MTEESSFYRVAKILLLVLGTGCLLLYGYLFWSGRITLRQGAETSPSRSAKELIDLWEAYERARAAAREEAEGAELISASAQQQSASEEELLSGVSSWSFVFYTNADKSVLDVIVDDESAKVVNQTRIWNKPEALTEGAWREGPRDALLVFLAQGGREFLEEHPQAAVSLHLGTNDGGEPVWDIAALRMDERSPIAVRIDAETLEVLSVTPGDE